MESSVRAHQAELKMIFLWPVSSTNQHLRMSSVILLPIEKRGGDNLADNFVDMSCPGLSVKTDEVKAAKAMLEYLLDFPGRFVPQKFKPELKKCRPIDHQGTFDIETAVEEVPYPTLPKTQDKIVNVTVTDPITGLSWKTTADEKGDPERPPPEGVLSEGISQKVPSGGGNLRTLLKVLTSFGALKRIRKGQNQGLLLDRASDHQLRIRRLRLNPIKLEPAQDWAPMKGEKITFPSSLP